MKIFEGKRNMENPEEKSWTRFLQNLDFFINLWHAFRECERERDYYYLNANEYTIDGKNPRRLFCGYISSQSQKERKEAQQIIDECLEGQHNFSIKHFSTETMQYFCTLLKEWHETYISQNQPVKRSIPLTCSKYG